MDCGRTYSGQGGVHALQAETTSPHPRCGLYHVSARPDGVHWDGIEYFDAKRGTGVLYAFRGSTASEGRHTFAVQGVLPGHTYRLHFADHSAPDRSIAGSELLQGGLTVALPFPLSSEIVFLDDVARPLH